MTILCYHSVQPGWASPLAVDPADFAEHCSWLVRRRQVLPLDEAVDRVDHRGRLPRGFAALTFDDGFAALYEHALPVLQGYRLPATVFLVAATLTATGHPVDWVDTPGEAPLRTLTRDQVLHMQEAGVSFQSHSYAHHDLTRLSFADCVADLRQSRELLSEVLGRPVGLLAYPRGRHNAQVRAAAARAGYRHAFGLPERAEPAGPYSIPRVGVYHGNSTTTVRVKSSRGYFAGRTASAFPVAQRIARQALRR
ncbi:MAG: polysaccharide deacetylase family protein [Deltaproteobacteria bacterium]|nr:polysaccharide deacetylase family protein [Deltaproteobacteria bacterium]